MGFTFLNIISNGENLNSEMVEKHLRDELLNSLSSFRGGLMATKKNYKEKTIHMIKIIKTWNWMRSKNNYYLRRHFFSVRSSRIFSVSPNEVWVEIK